MKSCSKRESQINGIIDATVGMYGDLQGITGKSMADIQALELRPDESRGELKL